MKKIVTGILTGLVFAACAPATEITGSWRTSNEQAITSSKKINTIVVAALTGRTNARQTVEDNLAAELQKNGFKAIKSMDIMPPTFVDDKTPDREKLDAKIHETGAEGVITVALLDEKTETRYQPGSYSYAPIHRFGYYGTFSGYYHNWYPALSSPGYYSEDKVYFMETNLYDAATEELLWSAQSQTYNPKNLEKFSKEFSEIVITRLKKDGLLSNGGTAIVKEQNRLRN